MSQTMTGSANCSKVPGPGTALSTGAPLSGNTPEQRSPSTNSEAPRELLAAWFRQHAAYLWRLVTRLGVPATAVDDVVQEVFILASRRYGEIAAGSERAFLRAVAIKLSANQRRLSHARHEVPCELPAGETSDAECPDSLLAQKRKRELLEVALRCLTGEQREVFVLYELEGHTVPEISAMLELPAGTVASRLGRGRERFSRAAARLHAQLTHAENSHVYT